MTPELDQEEISTWKFLSAGQEESASMHLLSAGQGTIGKSQQFSAIPARYLTGKRPGNAGSFQLTEFPVNSPLSEIPDNGKRKPSIPNETEGEERIERQTDDQSDSHYDSVSAGLDQDPIDWSDWLGTVAQPISDQALTHEHLKTHRAPDPEEPWQPFCPDIVPLIPVGAKLSPKSGVKPENIGKIPGKLLADGWCGLPGFTHATSTPDQVTLWRGQGAGFGIVGRRYPAIDIDITDEPLADALMRLAFKMLGEAPVRTGRAPKRLLMYRGTIGKRLRITLANKELVEVLGAHGHYVVEGIHPKTGKPYSWNELPRPDELTEITEQQVDAFLQAAEKLCAAHGFPVKAKVTASPVTSGEGHIPGGGRPRTVEEMETLLRFLDPDMPEVDWFYVICAIKSTPIAASAIPAKYQPQTEDPNLELALQWSRGEFWPGGSGKYQSDEEVTGRYDRADAQKPGGLGIAYLERMAEANAWQRPEKPSLEYEPMDLFGNITPEPALTRDMLPDVIANHAWDAAERMGVNPGLIVSAMLVTCAAATDDSIRVQPKRFDTTWLESARLNFLVSSPSGSLKTPALDTATAPLEKLDHDWQAEDGKAIARWKHREEERKAARKSSAGKATNDKPPIIPLSAIPDSGEAAKALSRAPDNGRTTKSSAGKAANGRKLSDEEISAQPDADFLPEKRPAKRRSVITDNTVEGVARILRDNPRGLLLKVDEVVGWLAGFDAYRSGKGGKDRAFWLQADNGGAYRKDRASEEASFEVPNLSVSIIGGIQPRKLRDLVSDLHDDGLIQRSFVITTDTSGDGQDRVPDMAALQAYDKLINHLVGLDTWEGARVTLSPEAHEHREAIEKLTKAFIRNPGAPEAFKEHLGKWPGRIARLMLLFHLIEGEGLVISGETAGKVRRFMVGFLLPHQIRFYHDYFQGAEHAHTDALWIAGYILAHKSTQITPRDIQRASYKPQHLVEAMELLTQANWITGKFEETTKRTTGWLVNPRVHELFTERADAERQRRDAIKRQIAEATRVRKQEGFE